MEDHVAGDKPAALNGVCRDQSGEAEAGRLAPHTPWPHRAAIREEEDDGARDVEPLLMRPELVARLLDISRSQVFELMSTGDLPSIKIGRSRRIPRDALRTWIDERLDASR